MRFVVLLFLALNHLAQATELFDMNRTSVRALGMGNAYTAVVRDADALFYNPAGIAKIGGINWTIFDIHAGGSNLEGLTKYAELTSSDDFTNALRDLYGEHVWSGAHAKTAFTMPFFAGAFYGTADTSFRVDNPAVPELEANLVYDYGIALGAGIPILPFMQVGAVVKTFTRTGSRTIYGTDVIGDLNADTLVEDFANAGTGLSLDMGFNLSMGGIVAPSLSFVWRNAGTTTFKASGDSAPPSDPDEMIIGGAVDISFGIGSVTPAFDLRYANRPDIDLARKLNFGVEVDLPLIDVRAGFNQGYYTLGAGMNMGLLRVDAATYGVELGEYAGQLEDRRYVLSVVLELGFDLGFGYQGAGDGGNGSRGGAYGRGSGPRLKRRR